MGKRILLITINGASIQEKGAILKWPKARGIPAKEITSAGMLCEIDADDLDEARSLGTVEVIGGKDAPEQSMRKAGA